MLWQELFFFIRSYLKFSFVGDFQIYCCIVLFRNLKKTWMKVPIKVQSIHATICRQKNGSSRFLQINEAKGKKTRLFEERWKFVRKHFILFVRAFEERLFHMWKMCCIHYIYNMYICMLKAYISCWNLFFYERTRSQWNMRSTGNIRKSIIFVER